MASYHVLYYEDDKAWKVNKENSIRASATANTKEAAREQAASIAKNNRPSYVYVHYKWSQSALDPVQEVIPYT